MKKLRYIQSVVCVLLLMFSVFGTAVHAENDLALKTQRLVAKLHDYYPNLTGTVLSVEGEQMFVDLGLKDGLLNGAQLAILQEGMAIVHPKTGKVLGNYEKQIGTIHITEVQNQFSVARVLWTAPDAELVPGTMIGGFTGRVKLAVLPVPSSSAASLPSDTIYDHVIRALRADNQFSVFDEADIKAVILQHGLAAEAEWQQDTFQQVNQVLRAHNFLQLRLQPDNNDLLTQIALLSDTGQEIGQVQEILHNYNELQLASAPMQPEVSQTSSDSAPAVAEPAAASEPASSADQSQAPSETPQKQRQFWTSDILRVKLNKIACGDLTGNGKNEVIVATRTDLHIFEHGYIGDNDSFLSLGQVKGYNDARIIAMGVGDLNQNGRAEIFITTFRGSNGEVRVFEYENGQFREIWNDHGLVMQVLHTPAGETHLIAQKTTSSFSADFLIGNVTEYRWDGSGYTRARALNVPGRAEVFGLALADLNQDGTNEALFYDPMKRIDIFQGGERRWRSRWVYETYSSYILRNGENDKKGRYYPGRIELTTLSKDTDVHMVLFRNFNQFKMIQNFPLYNGAQFYMYRWNGSRFVKELQSEEFESYIVDYAIADFDNDGKQEAGFAMVLKGDDYFRTPQSHIYVYELEQ